MASYTQGVQSFAVGYDAASRIASIGETGNPANTNSYGYDALDRLTQAILPNSNFSYGYDAVGNRITKTAGASTDTYAYPGTSNRLSSITPASGPVKTYTYDPAGNITGDGTSTYLYEARGRLVTATVAGVQYVRHYNGLGQRTYRVRSSNLDVVILNAYDEAGQPIGEYAIETTSGAVAGNETVYLAGIPVLISAFFVPGPGQPVQSFGPYYLHPDHLGTPRLVTDVANAVRWRWDPDEPFGSSPANENPSGLGPFGINFRFPGQYLDKESNTHYNMARDYSPDIGRYIQSDPIGLAGGLNTYLYVGASPIDQTDPSGLQPRPNPNVPRGPKIYYNAMCRSYAESKLREWDEEIERTSWSLTGCDRRCFIKCFFVKQTALGPCPFDTFFDIFAYTKICKRDFTRGDDRIGRWFCDTGVIQAKSNRTCCS